MDPDKFILAVLVSGRGSNLQAIIDSIEKNDLSAEIALVVSNVKDTYALERAHKQGLEVLFLDPKSYPDRNGYEQALVERIQSKSVNLICLAGFMRVLGKHFIETFSGRIINIHPSLLPKYKGTNTHKRVLKSKEKYSGCTVHFVTPQLDSGKIILQKRILIKNNETVSSLKNKILKQEHKLYPQSIISIFK